jgi:NADH-quinone oxidoreductase subunit C
MTFENLKLYLTGIAAMVAPTAPSVIEGAEPAPTPAPVPQISETDHAKRGTDLDVTVPADRVNVAAHIMDSAGYVLEAITGVDWLAENQFEVVYDYTLWASGQRVTVRTRIPRDNPALPTVSAIYPGANWHERETHDFFGIQFEGHPDLTPLLLPEDATFHPLRKDFVT